MFCDLIFMNQNHDGQSTFEGKKREQYRYQVMVSFTLIGNPDQKQVVTFNFKLILRITLHLIDRNDQA